MKTVLVCGGRDYHDREFLFLQLSTLHEEDKIEKIINGGAPGADTLSTLWAARTGVQFSIYRADWHRHGMAAGPIRNQRMLDDGKPNLVVAFPGGTGTADMVRKARAANVKVIDFDV